MRRRLIIVLIAFAALVIPAVLIAFVVNRSPQLQNTVLKLANVNTANTNIANTNASTNTNTSAAAEQASINYVSRNFTETYGNESNQNNFSNIAIAQKWGTQNFNDFLNRTVTQQRASLKTTPYRAIVTRVLVVTITKQAAATASVTISTQRQETNDKTTTTYYQDIILELTKQGADWKINAASWKAV